MPTRRSSGRSCASIWPPGPGGDRPPLRGRPAGGGQRPAAGARDQLPDRPADPRHLRLHHRRSSIRSPTRRRRRRSEPGRGRRLRPRRAGALFRHRPAVPAALQADAPLRAGGGVHPLPAVGPGAEGRAGGALDRRMPGAAPRATSPSAPRCWRRAISGATRRCSTSSASASRRNASRARARPSIRPSSPSGRCGTNGSAPSRYAARAQHQGRQGRAARPADPALDRPLPLRRRDRRRSWSRKAC